MQGKPLLQAINDEAWVRGEFNETVQKRGAEIIKWRGASSAASAASAAIDHIHDWELGNDDWVTVGMHSQGNTYGVDQNLFFGFPAICKNGK